MDFDLYLLSQIFGWGYFFCWSLSFYAQPVLNWRRKAASGLSREFMYLNFSGFVFYSIYTVSSYIIQKAHHLPPSVTFNDIAFSLNALVLTTIIIAQAVFYYDVKHSKSPEKQTRPVTPFFRWIIIGLWVGAFAHVGLSMIHVIPFGNVESAVNPMAPSRYGALHYLGYSKAFISFVKYIPQSYLNYTRKSTTGWSIGAVILDFGGGILSFAQQAVNVKRFNDWTIFYSNIPKLLLASESCAFDILFMIQHFCLYRNSHDTAYDPDLTEERRLLRENTFLSNTTTHPVPVSYSNSFYYPATQHEEHDDRRSDQIHYDIPPSSSSHNSYPSEYNQTTSLVGGSKQIQDHEQQHSNSSFWEKLKEGIKEFFQEKLQEQAKEELSEKINETFSRECYPGTFIQPSSSQGKQENMKKNNYGKTKLEDEEEGGRYGSMSGGNLDSDDDDDIDS